LFDNFESMLNDKGEVADPELRDFFSAIFAGEHKVRALIVAREIPKFSRRERVVEFETVGGSLFEGLPLADCLSYLKKNGGTKDLRGSMEEIESVLKDFSQRVHRIPLALVWAVGYLSDTGFTLRQVLDREDLFAYFDKEQTKDAERYENKGLKRLHYEQLKIQPSQSLPVLRLLAFFKRAVPKGAFAHLLDEIELSKILTRLEHNKLVTRKESADAYTRYLNEDLAINLYGLHPVICENEFFGTLPDKETLYETSADECWARAYTADEINRFAYALELYDCAEKLFEHLIRLLNRADLRNSYAAMLVNKGVALQNLSKLPEAIAEYDKAIAIRERLVNTEQQAHLADDLAGAYMNKGVALMDLTRLAEAIAEYDKAIAIRERLVNTGQQAHLANDLAMAYVNKGNALQNLTKLVEAMAEYDKAIAIRERLVNTEQQAHLANDLAMAYMNKGNALQKLTKLVEAIAVYDKAIAIHERLVNTEQQAHLANDVAMAYRNKALALEQQPDFDEALCCYEKSLQATMFCVEDLNMFWIMPELLKTLRYRLMTLLGLERWAAAARDVLQFRSLFTSYVNDNVIDEGLKEAAREESAQMVSRLRTLSAEQRELLYAELGDDAAAVRSLVDG
jgi:tetratricopeptide (TPR) repeat protein